MTQSQALRPWYRELTGYHWFVLTVCTLGWLFDCLDQQLFIIARQAAVAELRGLAQTDPEVGKYAGYATSVLLIGWATGGILFGIMGDRVGRAKTMVWTILSYSVFTGLSGFSVGLWDFLFYRFMTGLGVGGQFAVGVSLVAEVMPDRARAPALGMLQALSAVGNVSAALIAMGFGALTAAGTLPGSSWRWMFGVGVLPALLAVVVISRLKEPERWKKAVVEGVGRQKAGSLAEMFGTPKWRHRVIVGMILASSGVIGLWAIGFFSVDLNRSVFRKNEEQKARDEGQAELDRHLVRLAIQSPGQLDELARVVRPQNLLSLDPKNKDPQLLYAAALELHRAERQVSTETVLGALDRPAEGRPAQSAEDRQRRAEYLAGGEPAAASAAEYAQRIEARRKRIEGQVGWWGSITSMLFNVGAFFGIYAFSRITQKAGRKATFALFFTAALASTAVAFRFMYSATDVFWMVPLMGFCQLSLFGGYAIYFPELFPTRLRSTGTSLCYNIARYFAASGPAVLGLLTSAVFTPARGFFDDQPLRYAGLTMCAVFLIGLAVLPFAPETKGQPLPE
jgi:MFS family permease